MKIVTMPARVILQPGIGRAHGSCSILFRTTSACHPKSVPRCCHPHADANARTYRTGCWRCASHPAASTACWPPASESADIQSVGGWFGGWYGKGLLSRAGAASGQRTCRRSAPVSAGARLNTRDAAMRKLGSRAHRMHLGLWGSSRDLSASQVKGVVG